MKKALLVAVLLILVGLGFWAIRALPTGRQAPRANAPSVPAQNTESTAPMAPTANMTTVSIANFAFGPSRVQIKKGAMVQWTNADAPTHTVTSDTGAFDSGPLKTGSSFSYTFQHTGTFPYHCSFHPSMHGTVVVTE